MRILSELEEMVSTSMDRVCCGGPERCSEVLWVSVWLVWSGLWHRQDLQGCWPSLHLGEECVGSPPIDQGAHTTQEGFYTEPQLTFPQLPGEILHGKGSAFMCINPVVISGSSWAGLSQMLSLLPPPGKLTVPDSCQPWAQTSCSCVKCHQGCQ